LLFKTTTKHVEARATDHRCGMEFLVNYRRLQYWSSLGLAAFVVDVGCF